jgi:hypothetical protein
MARSYPAVIRGGVAVGEDLPKLADGVQVEVVTLDDDDPLSPEDLAELEAANDEADREEGIPLEEALRILRERRAERSRNR